MRQINPKYIPIKIYFLFFRSMMKHHIPTEQISRHRRRCSMKIIAIGEIRVVVDWIGIRKESKIIMIEHSFDIL